MTERIGRAVPPPSGRAPMLTMAPRDVEGLGDELDRYHDRFAGGFVRCEQRRWALKYSQGQTTAQPSGACAGLGAQVD